MIVRHSNWFWRILTVLFLCFSIPVVAKEITLPEHLVILAYNGEAWYPYQVHQQQWQQIKAIRNPASITFRASDQQFYFKGDDNKLYSYRFGAKNVEPIAHDSAKNTKNPHHIASYTQLRAYDTGVVMVELLDGKSIATQLVDLDKDGTTKNLFHQEGSQFNPMIQGDYLYYAQVTCRLNCNPIIQDVWRFSRKTARSEQITRLNATSALNAITDDGNFGFISSNQSGFYHIYRINLRTNETVRLTQGRVTDSYPVVTKNNGLIFMRRDEQGTSLNILVDVLAQQSDTIAPLALPLPKGVSKIRYLELIN